jgi:hypothetical protein
LTGTLGERFSTRNLDARDHPQLVTIELAIGAIRPRIRGDAR